MIFIYIVVESLSEAVKPDPEKLKIVVPVGKTRLQKYQAYAILRIDAIQTVQNLSQNLLESIIVGRRNFEYGLRNSGRDP